MRVEGLREMSPMRLLVVNRSDEGDAHETRGLMWVMKGDNRLKVATARAMNVTRCDEGVNGGDDVLMLWMKRKGLGGEFVGHP